MNRICPECRERPVPDDFKGFRALRCYECGVRWLQERARIVPGLVAEKGVA